MICLINYCYFANEDITKAINKARMQQSQTHLSEVEKHTKFHNEIMKKLYLQIPPELSEDKEIDNLLKELDNRNEEVAVSWSMYLFKG